MWLFQTRLVIQQERVYYLPRLFGVKRWLAAGVRLLEQLVICFSKTESQSSTITKGVWIHSEVVAEPIQAVSPL